MIERDGDDTAGTPDHNLHVDAQQVAWDGLNQIFDAPHPSGDDRFAVYVVTRRGRWRVAETGRDGIGICLTTLRDEDQITNDSRVGILDRETRRWVLNPWAKGDT